MEQVISMVTALVLIGIILLSGGFRTYFRHKFDVTQHLDNVARAAQRQQKAKQRLHNVQHN